MTTVNIQIKAVVVLLLILDIQNVKGAYYVSYIAMARSCGLQDFTR